MDDMKEKFGVKTVCNFIIMGCTILVVGISIVRTLGCISFSSAFMKDMFFASAMLLGMVYIYECGSIKENNKWLLCGVLSGTILFVYEQFLLLLLLFVVNIIWDKVEATRKFDFVLGDVAKLFFFSMFTLEMYSVCALNNEYLYNNMMETTQVFKFVDILFIFSMIVYFICDKQKENATEDDDIKNIFRKRRYVEITRVSVWCILVLGTVFMVISKLYFEVGNPQGNQLFYFGKTMDAGYLLCQDASSEWICYVRKVGETSGGVLENMASFQMSLLESDFSVQKFVAYMVKYMCQFVYSVYGVVIMALVTMWTLIHKLLRCKCKKIEKT